MALELAVTLVAALLGYIGGSAGVGKLSRALLQKIAVIGLFWAFITSFPLWIPKIILSFDQAGSTLSATAGLQPSAILDRGVLLAAILLYVMQQLGLWSSLAAIPSAILVYLSTLGVVVCFALIAARLVEALVKSYLVMAGAVFFLGFAPFRLTAPLAENYLITCVRIGVQIFVQYLLVAVGETVTGGWIVSVMSYTPDQGFRLPLTILGGSIVYAWLVIKIPSDSRLLAHGTDGIPSSSRGSDRRCLDRRCLDRGDHARAEATGPSSRGLPESRHSSGCGGACCGRDSTGFSPPWRRLP